MRNDIVHPGADELTYAIREIVSVGERMRGLGVPIYWENIGDPVAKGAKIPQWIKDIIADLVINNDKSYGYSPTQGLLETREYLAEQRNKEGGAQITPNDILFFNGLGDAIQTSFLYLNPNARILGPDPAYPTYSSAEAAHADAPHQTYKLLPKENWQPDLEEIENKVKYNPLIAGILIINPDNPTGTVYSRAALEGIVAIAKKYDLFIMSDEIYSNIVYDGEMTPISQVLDGVPGIAMKGLSKEIPWPGARCGWIEVYNREADETFSRYVRSLVNAKMLEVCSTTLPQMALPKIFHHPNYPAHLKAVAATYGKKADLLAERFSRVEGVLVNKPLGAFYASIVFKSDVLNDKQTLPIENKELQALVEELVVDTPLDKRFVYYLMAATGITLVPLSGMNTNLLGFRMTLLEPDMNVFTDMLDRIADHISTYLNSHQ